MVLELVGWYYSQRDQLNWSLFFFYVLTALEKNLFKMIEFFLSSEIVLSPLSDIFSEDFILPDSKGFSVLQNCLWSLASFSFRLEK